MLIRSPAASGWGYVATWGRQSENGKDVVGMALFYPLAEISIATDDGRSYYVRFKNPAKVRYAFAVAWVNEGGGITDEAGFRAYLDQTAAGFFAPRDGHGRREINTIRRAPITAGCSGWWLPLGNGAAICIGV